MKKLFYFFSLTAALAFAAGCAKEVDVDPVKGDLVETTFTVTLDDATATKAAIGNNAALINKLLVRAFKTDGTSLKDLDGNFEVENLEPTTVDGKKQFSFKAKLVRNFPYKIAFFAINSGAPYSLDDDGFITMAAGDANDETLDAFYQVAEVTLTPNESGIVTTTYSITLKRPLAQINILSDDLDWTAASSLGILDGLKSSITVKQAYTKLKLFDGTVDTAADLAFTEAASPSNTITIDNQTSHAVGTVYVFSSTNGSTNDVTFSIPSHGQFGGFTRTIKNVPVKRNYRTNLHGDLFTVSGDFTVTIDPAWGGNDDNQDINIPQPTVSPASIPDGISSANPGIVTGASVATTGNNISLTTASSPLYFGIDSNSDGAISYASSAPTVGTITEDGVFTVVGAGDTDVTIHQMAGKTKAVNDPLSDITIIYHIHVEALEAVATPAFTPVAGAVAANTTVAIACATEGATIYYTVDGTDPTTSSTEYSSAITIDIAKTIKAIAVKEGMANSEIATAEYTIMGVVANPTFSPAAGAVAENTTVAIACATEGATIYYTVDGTDPTTSSTEYSSAITINAAKTIKAIAVKDGMVNSAVAEAAYTIAVADPVLESIAITGQTTSFTVGDKFAVGGTVTASYDTGDDHAVTENLTYTIDGNAATPGSTDITYAMNGKNVVVSYTEGGVTKSANAYAITVNKKARITAVAFASPSAKVANTSVDFLLPSLTGLLGSDLVEYTSSNATVAVVDESNPSEPVLFDEDQTGVAIITATVIDADDVYADAEATFTLTVKNPAPALSFTNETTMTAGTPLTLAVNKGGSDGTVTYSIVAAETTAEGAAIDGTSLSATGTGSVKVLATLAETETYLGTTANCTITVNAAAPSKTLTSIAVTTNPTKTEYIVDETFDATGMVVTATYSDSSSEEITTGYTTDASTVLASSGANKPITVSYTEESVTKTASFNVSVTDVYVLNTSDTENGSNNSYTGNCDVEYDNITWNVAGNAQMHPWRLGGKSITNQDRAVYSKTAISSDVYKIEIESGAASSCTVNSLTLTVHNSSSDAQEGTNAIATFVKSTQDDIVNKTVTFEKADQTSWSNKYYRIVYNVTVSGTSNKFVEFKTVTIYGY